MVGRVIGKSNLIHYPKLKADEPAYPFRFVLTLADQTAQCDVVVWTRCVAGEGRLVCVVTPLARVHTAVAFATSTRFTSATLCASPATACRRAACRRRRSLASRPAICWPTNSSTAAASWASGVPPARCAALARRGARSVGAARAVGAAADRSGRQPDQPRRPAPRLCAAPRRPRAALAAAQSRHRRLARPAAGLRRRRPVRRHHVCRSARSRGAGSARCRGRSLSVAPRRRRTAASTKCTSTVGCRFGAAGVVADDHRALAAERHVVRRGVSDQMVLQRPRRRARRARRRPGRRADRRQGSAQCCVVVALTHAQPQIVRLASRNAAVPARVFGKSTYCSQALFAGRIERVLSEQPAVQDVLAWRTAGAAGARARADAGGAQTTSCEATRGRRPGRAPHTRRSSFSRRCELTRRVARADASSRAQASCALKSAVEHFGARVVLLADLVSIAQSLCVRLERLRVSLFLTRRPSSQTIARACRRRRSGARRRGRASDAKC